jgi:hypothetical protein
LTEALTVVGAVPIGKSTCSQSLEEFMAAPNVTATAFVVSVIGCDGIDETAPA